MNIWGRVLRMFGWRVDITVGPIDKCVICVAPHTSNFDFLIGLAAYRSIGRKASFLMKEAWFFFPLKYLLRHLGGIPVPAKRGSDLTRAIVNDFKQRTYMNLAVTPEGTRSRRADWRKGFLYIVRDAEVPLLLGIIDYHGKRVIIKDIFHCTGDVETDMKNIKAYYKEYSYAARYPEKFTTE